MATPTGAAAPPPKLINLSGIKGGGSTIPKSGIITLSTTAASSTTAAPSKTVTDFRSVKAAVVKHITTPSSLSGGLVVLGHGHPQPKRAGQEDEDDDEEYEYYDDEEEEEVEKT